MKKLYLITPILFFLLFVCINLHAQNLQWAWSKSYGHTGNESGQKIAVDSRNGVYTFGTFSSSNLNIGSFSLVNNGISDLFLCKHDTLGNLLWAKSFGSTGIDSTGNITTDVAGNIIIAGSFSNSINLGAYNFTSGGAKNTFVAKLDNAGNFIWAEHFVSGGEANTSFLKTDHLNNIYLAGNYNNAPINFGSISLAASGQSNIFYSKLDAAGNVIWANKNNTNAISHSICNIELLSNNRLMLLGQAKVSGSINFDPSPSSTPFVFLSGLIFSVKIDTAGNFLSQNAGSLPGSLGSSIMSRLGNNNDILTVGYQMFLSNPYPRTLHIFSDSNYVMRHTILNLNLGNVGSSTSSAQDIVYNNKRAFIAGTGYGHTGFNGGFEINEPDKNYFYIDEKDTNGVTKNLIHSSPHVNSPGIYLNGAVDTLTNSLYFTGNITSTQPVVLFQDVLLGNGGQDILISKISINGYLPVFTMHDTSICAGQSVGLGLNNDPSFGQAPYSYSWSPTTGLSHPDSIRTNASPATTTTYTLHITDALGSTTNQTVTVVVNQIPATPTITASGPLNFCAGGNVVLTSSSATGNIWSNGATTQSITVSSSGSYSVKVSTGSCTSSSSAIAMVNVNPLPATPTITAGGPLHFCAGGSVILTSSVGSGYLWSNGATTQSITVTNSGSYSVTVSNGTCVSHPSTAVTVHVNANPSTPIITAGGPISFCNGGSVILTASAGSNYLWSNGATTQSITVTANGNYSVRDSSNSGCVSAYSTPVNVQVNPIPATLSVTASGPLSFCNGGSVVLTAGAGSNYLWSNGASTQSITVTSSGHYSVRDSSNAGCIGAFSTPVVVLVNPVPAAPSISANGPLTFCAGNNVVLTASAGSNYLWSNAATTQSISVSTSGSYSVRDSSNTGCVSPASPAQVVLVNPLPPIPTIIQNGNLLSSSSATGNQWFLNGSIIPGATSSTYLYTIPGDYSVTVTNAEGCQTSSTTLTTNRLNGTITNLSNGDLFYHQVSPNPIVSNGRITYKLASASKISITLMGSNGKLISVLLPEKNQPAGTYIIPIGPGLFKLNNGKFYILYRINADRVTDGFIIAR